MNIYVQNKTAKDVGILKEIDKPLDPKVNRLFCWNVVLVNKFGRILDNMNFLIITNVQTDYSIYVPLFKEQGESFFESIEKFIRIGLEQLNIDQEIIDYYFDQAGKFEFGLMTDASLALNLRRRAIDNYRNIDKIDSQEQGCIYLTNKYSSKSYYFNHNFTYREIMENALTDLYNNNQRGFKAYELLITIDVEEYQITRRIIVPADITFYDLHLIFQNIFEWWNYHLAEFNFFEDGYDELDYLNGFGDFVLDETDPEYREPIFMHDYKLSDLIENYNTITYNYDLGYNWIHDIKILNIYDNYLGEAPYLLEAHYSAPPEDVGDVELFLEYLRIINDPTHEEYEHLKNWRKWKKNLGKKMRTPHKIKIKN